LAVILVGLVKDLPFSSMTTDDTASLKRDGGNAMESDDSKADEDGVGNTYGERVTIPIAGVDKFSELNALPPLSFHVDVTVKPCNHQH
jgi:hypothetical protein